MKKYLVLLSLSLMTGLALCDKQPPVKIDEAPVSQAALDEQKAKEFAVKIQETLKNNPSIIQQYISQNNPNTASNKIQKHKIQKQINMSLKGINFSVSLATLYYIDQCLKEYYKIAPGQNLPIIAQVAMMLPTAIFYWASMDITFSAIAPIANFFGCSNNIIKNIVESYLDA